MLSKNNKELEEEAGFDAYFFGPHSELADAEMEEMVQLGVVKKVGSIFVLTEIGKDIAYSVSKNTSKSSHTLSGHLFPESWVGFP